uniref:cartilage-associated protein isoform X1 n=1 Tax=Myxine glutinosa TaxID=7769 RepID=UPI00358E2DEC
MAPRLCAFVLISLHVLLAEAQYEQYDFQAFPRQELMPLEAAYRHGTERYEAEEWSDCSHYLELALRLHRLLRDSNSFCNSNCSTTEAELDTSRFEGFSELEVFSRLLQRAHCLKRCKQILPAFRQSQPSREIIQEFVDRVPYQFLQLCYYKLNNLPKAMAATHTYLRKHPDDDMMLKNMAFYRSLPNAEEEYFRDIEAKPYDGLFVRAAKAFNMEDYKSCVANMELAIPNYLKEYDDCVSVCEGAREIVEFKDFFPSIADHYIEVLACKMSCEADLIPEVGGFMVEKFVPTMYHYLQFSYYKLGNFKEAVSCVKTYLLFDPEDEIMNQNLDYYLFHRDHFNFADDDFKPRPEAINYHEEMQLLKSLSSYAHQHLLPDDEMEVKDKERARRGLSDAEFEGEGDYEESIYADNWEQGFKGDLGIRNIS